MRNFQLTRLKDFLYFQCTQPHKKGKGIEDIHVSQLVRNLLNAPIVADNSLIAKLRQSLLNNHTILTIHDFGAGSKRTKSTQRKVSHIAKVASSSPKKGQLLQSLIQTQNPAVVVELGTSLGLGTLYLAMANANIPVYTIEGSTALYQQAKQNFEASGVQNIHILPGSFDDVLPQLLAGFAYKALVYVDGNHTREATLRYFNLLAENLQPNSVIVFDDIRWSPGMYSAWLDICGDQRVKLSLDLFDVGIVFLDNKIIKQHLRIYY